MKFVLMICHDHTFQPTEKLVTEILAWDQEMIRRGIRLAGNPLRPASEGVTMQVRDGLLQTRAGPFSESDLQLSAYELVECSDLQSAIELAATHPMAKLVTIEVRAVWEELTR